MSKPIFTKNRIIVLLAAILLIMAAVTIYILVFRQTDTDDDPHLDETSYTSDNNEMPPDYVTLRLDTDATFQTIEGFGFFGAHDVWWSNNPFDSPEAIEWIDTILIDLGITMWRNEAYPFVPPYSLQTTNQQDSNWNEQKPFVKALNDRAIELGIPLRIIVTVWSPPGEWKTSGTTRNPPYPQPNYLLPAHYEDFGYWLVEVIQMYKDIGVDVYAISPQNEPAFGWQGYNSSFYSAETYVDMLNVVAPIVNYYFPNVYIFGAEAMLEHEYRSYRHWGNRNMQFHRALVGQLARADGASPEALQNFVFAHHGYADGIVATNPDMLDSLWRAERELIGSDVRLWMTETSGYFHNWLDIDENQPGALSLAAAIQSALIHGDISAWVYWQGQGATQVNPHYHQLMNLIQGWPQYKYTASQHFFRYIRPGAVRVGAEFVGEFEQLTVSAFVHEEMDSTTIVIVNTQDASFTMDIAGMDNLIFDSFISDGTSDTITSGPQITNGEQFYIPAHSIITLISGEYREPIVDIGDYIQRRDVALAVSSLERLSNRGTTFVASSNVVRSEVQAIAQVRRHMDSRALGYDWEFIEPMYFSPAIDASPGVVGVEGYLNFRVLIQQGDLYEETDVLTLRIIPAMSATGTLSIDLSQQYQTHEGFGIHGSPVNFNQAWTDEMINTLGITMWRQDIYEDSLVNWSAHRSVVESMVMSSEAIGTPLRVILSVISPPEEMMTEYILDEERYNDFAIWLIDGINMYQEAGAYVYAVSFQHEPLWPPGEYTIESYIQMFNAVAPVINNAFPDIKIFGPQNVRMFEVSTWGAGWAHFTEAILDDTTTLGYIDAFAMHTERVGVALASVMSEAVNEWSSFYELVTDNSDLPIWNTQFHAHNLTSEWHSVEQYAGGLITALELQVALKYGGVSAWLINHGFLTINETGYIEDSAVSTALTHFFRFIQPGFIRVSAEHNSDSNVLVTAWHHQESGSYVVVIVNPDDVSFNFDITGHGLPSYFYKYISTAASEDIVRFAGQITDIVEIPAGSVITLVHDNIRRDD